ncbi:MAG: hypothetical protein AAGU19_01235 [Prolixibacteraceae bacterium]
MKRFLKWLIIILVGFGIVEVAYLLIFPSKGIETFPVVYITDGSTIRISCPEKIIHYKTDKALEGKLVQEKTLEVRLKQPGDSSWLVTVASENYFASWNFTYLPGENPDEIVTTIRMTEKDRIGKIFGKYRKWVGE